MKTNATPRSVIKAVENVSAKKYNGNVVFMNWPKKITKYVCRFTLRTKDVNGPGSMVTKAGQKQPKANWEVQQDVMKEILRLNPYPNIYVDTIYGREFSTGQTIPSDVNPDQEEIDLELEPVNKEVPETEEETEEQEEIHDEPTATVATVRKHELVSRKKREKVEKPTGRKKPKVINGKAKLLSALNYLLKHPELLD